jgi:hypothetical protein
VANTAPTKTSSMYSPMKKMPQRMPEYSRLNPMISDSPSGMSKGMRLDSAMAAARKRMAPMGWTTRPHRKGLGPCQLAMAMGSRVP